MARGLHALLFVGTFELTIDAKQRMAIPADVRDRLARQVAAGVNQIDGDGGEGPAGKGAEAGQAFYCVLQEGPTLCLYTEAGFEKRARDLDESERSPEEILLYEQMFYANARRLELDKQGRVRLPERLLEMAGLGRDVVVLGVKDHLQVHDREAWSARMAELLENRPDLLMNPRLAMKRGE